jgi:hypothetical protein
MVPSSPVIGRGHGEYSQHGRVPVAGIVHGSHSASMKPGKLPASSCRWSVHAATGVPSALGRAFGSGRFLDGSDKARPGFIPAAQSSRQALGFLTSLDLPRPASVGRGLLAEPGLLGGPS